MLNIISEIRKIEYDDNNNVNSGVIIVYKNIGETSHDVVNTARKQFKIRKVGHAGALDPFAEGLMIIALAKSTKELKYYILSILNKKP